MPEAPTATSGPGGPDGLPVGRRFVIPPGELQWRFSASSGPGGQHVNTSNTRAELTFDIAKSTVLGPRQRARLMGRYGEALRVVAGDERSQARNRELAMQRLAARLDEALRETAPRRPTAPTAASRRRRLRDKQRRSDLKESRRRSLPDD